MHNGRYNAQNRIQSIAKSSRLAPTDFEQQIVRLQIDDLRVFAELQENGLLKVAEYADALEHAEGVGRNAVGAVGRLLQVLVGRLNRFQQHRQIVVALDVEDALCQPHDCPPLPALAIVRLTRQRFHLAQHAPPVKEHFVAFAEAQMGAAAADERQTFFQ